MNPEHFADSLEHLLAELERIDLLVRGQVAALRSFVTTDEQFRGLYISEQEVDALLARPLGAPSWLRPGQGWPAELNAAHDRLKHEIALRKGESSRCGIELRLAKLELVFELAPFEIDVLLVCLAAELDLRYEKLYAYLQDDVTKKKASVDLLLCLLLPTIEARIDARKRLSPNAALLRHLLVDVIDDPSQPRSTLLARYVKLDDRIVRYLLGSDEPDERLHGFVTMAESPSSLGDLVLADDVRRGLQGLPLAGAARQRVVIHLQGPYGAGKETIAAAVCRDRSLRLMVVNLDRLLAEPEGTLPKLVTLIIREAHLQNAAVLWKNFDLLLLDAQKGALALFLRNIVSGTALSFLAGEAAWEPSDVARGVFFINFQLPRPTGPRRTAIWRAALGSSGADLTTHELDQLASAFKLTYGQIHDAAATARNAARWRDPAESPRVTLRDLYESCRAHSNQKLATLASKTTPKYKWGDIVLPEDRVAQLREICNHMKYRDRVYGDWGFGGKLSLGKGLAVLFAGPSGTGKTMAAEIVAGELGLELYKIDLSTVVSKYIGETEKNLSRIFTEAETSNAILFFDEADALFGKRSEVRDSHDRYANIEIGYLLQRMEEYEGVVILATNFRKNMDEAFVRRLHFSVDFPLPSQEDRHRIWGNIWPEDTPRDQEMDVGFLARRFEITGGSIRNIALAAAFLAADDGNVVQMRHVMIATRREYGKMGKLLAEGQFKLGEAS